MQQQQKEKKNSVEECRAHSPVLYWGTVVTLVLIVITFVIGPVFGSGYAKSISLGKAAGKTIYFDENFGYAWESYERNLAAAYGVDLQNAPDYMRSQLRVSAFQGAFFMTAYENFIESILDKSGIVATSQKAEHLIARSILAQADPVAQKESLKAYKELSDKQRQTQIDGVKKEYLSMTFREDLALIPEIRDFETSFLNEKAFPQKRALRYLQIDEESLPDSYFIEYASQSDKINLFTQLSFRKILVSTETEMEFLLDEIKKDPEGFSRLAEDSTIDTDGGKETTPYFYELLNQFGTENETEFLKLAALKTGELSEVIKTEYGYLLFQITKESVPADLENDEIVTEIRDYIAYNDSDAAAAFVTDLTSAAADAAAAEGLTQAAETLGLTVLTTRPFAVNVNGLAEIGRIQNEDGEDVLNSVYGDESFFKAVFTAETNKVAETVYTDAGNIIYEVSEIEEAATLGDSASLASLIPGGDEGFQNYILNHKSYRDNTQKFMETYSEMFSYSAE